MGFCISSLFDTRSRTIVVAASNSIDPKLAPEAYRCDGVADQVEINAAITALGATGGTVILLEGTYEITASINLATLTALMGQGAGTVLFIPNGHDANLNVISAVGVNRVLVADLRSDGNKANQAAGNMNGIYFETVTYSKISNCWIENMYSGQGIYLRTSSNNNTITGNICQSNDEDGIVAWDSSNNTIAGNICRGNGMVGVALRTSSNNTTTGNICQDNGEEGIWVWSSSNNNTITGNICQGNGWRGIYLYDSSNNNTIVGNTVVGNSQETDNVYDGIFLQTDCDHNNVQSNTVRHEGGAKQHRYGINITPATCEGNLVTNNDLYLSGKTANFNNAGTGTVVINNRGWVTENNVLSPAFAIDAIAVVTVTIPHGLNVTPSVEDCQLTVVEDTDVDDWAEGYVKVESVGAANVVAKVNVTTASVTGSATAKLALHVDLAGA